MRHLKICIVAILAAFLASCANNSKYFGEVPAVLAEQETLAKKARNSKSNSSEEMKKWIEKGDALQEKLNNAYKNLSGVEWKLDSGDSIKVVSPLTLRLVEENRYGFEYKLLGKIEVLEDIPVRMDKYAIESLHGRTSCGIYVLAWYGKNGYPKSGYVKNDGTDPISWVSKEIGTVEMKTNGDKYYIPAGSKITIDSEPFSLNLDYDGKQDKCDKMCFIFSTDNRILK